MTYVTVPGQHTYQVSTNGRTLCTLLNSKTLTICDMSLFQGLGVGGLWGLREGAKRPLAVSNTRLRINSVLNSVTRRGTFMANSAGVLGVTYFRI
jgi:Tim17/Tim22/Tim23/Pmp24 family